MAQALKVGGAVQLDVTSADITSMAPTVGIHVNASGLVKMKLKDRASVWVTLYLLQGIDYPYEVVAIESAGTDAAIRDDIYGLY